MDNNNNIVMLYYADENDSHEVSRMVFRRLSHTTQTDALLGHLDENTGGRLIIRPKSVQVTHPDACPRLQCLKPNLLYNL